MRQVLTMILAVFLPVGTAWGQNFEAGMAAYEQGNYAAALQAWRPLAESGDALAQLQVGFAYRTGRGVEQNDTEGAKWIRSSAQQGLAEAQLHLGAIYILGEGVLQDFALASMWLIISCAGGEQQSCRVRDTIAKKMLSSDISHAQRLARHCVESNYKYCD